MHTNIQLHKATQPWPITLKDMLPRWNVHHDSSVWNTARLILFISIIYQRKAFNIDYFPICTFSITLSDGNNRNSLGMALALMPPPPPSIASIIQRNKGHVIYEYIHFISLLFLLTSSSLRLMRFAIAAGSTAKSLSGMLSRWSTWQLNSCYWRKERDKIVFKGYSH